MLDKIGIKDREEFEVVKRVDRNSKRQLMRYIKENLSRGYSLASIKKALVNYGYDRLLVDYLVDGYNKKVSAVKYFGITFMLLLFGLGMFFIEPSPTGFVTLDKEFNYTDLVDISIDSSQSFEWTLHNYGDLSSVRLEGSASRDFVGKAYILSGDSRYLVLDSSEVEGVPESSKSLVEDVSGFGGVRDVNEVELVNDSDEDISITLIGGGRKDIEEVFDFEIRGAFDWDLDYSRLCSRYDVESYSTCYGDASCCAFIGLESYGEWNDTFYLSYGRYDSGLNNTVKAQIIYYDVDMGVPYSDIRYSKVKEAGAEFYEARIEFSDICIESCLLYGFNKTTYNLSVVVEEGDLEIKGIRYGTKEEVNVSDKAPILMREVEDITVFKNEFYKINLSDYFFDEDDLVYSIEDVEGTTIIIMDGVAAIVPDYDFIGNMSLQIIASDGYYEVESNTFVVEVIERHLTASDVNVTEEVFKPSVIINRPVRWIKRINVSEDVMNLSFEISSEALNFSVMDLSEGERIDDDKLKVNDMGVIKDAVTYRAEKRIEQIEDIEKTLSNRKKEIVVEDPTAKEDISEINKELLELQDERNRLTGYVVLGNEKGILTRFFEWLFNVEITGYAVYDETSSNVTSVVIEEVVEQVEVEYYTEGPVSDESDIDDGKRIVISSDIHYTDILAYTYVDNFPEWGIDLYHIVEGKREEVGFESYDEDGDGLIDYIEWIVPSLSNQTYEVTITILNVHSYPKVGGNWTVEFDTTGTANLTITATMMSNYTQEYTRWSNYSEDKEIFDLMFLDIKCGDESLDYVWEGENCSEKECSVKIADYSCNETGYEISEVLTPKKHVLRFSFGNQEAYAFNAVQNISECTILSTAGTYYLNESIYDEVQSYCMEITSNNVVLDCQGNVIDGDGIAENAIYVERFSPTHTNITIRNCTVTDWNSRGISIIRANGNIIEGVNLTLNPDIGLYLLGSDDNNITGSSFSNNSYGIYVESSSNNTIYDNIFNNTENVFFGGTVFENNWNVSKTDGVNVMTGNNMGGNYWADPNGTGFSEGCNDTNGDSICDETYTLTSGDIDYLPLIMPDRIGPTVSLTSPVNDTNTSTSAQTFACSLTDNRWLANITLYVWNSSGAVNYTRTTNVSGISNSSNWGYSLPYDGTFFWNCLGYDAAGNYNWSTQGNYTITLDTIPPNVTILYPTTLMNISSNSIDFNATAKDNRANTLLFYWIVNGSMNSTGVDSNSTFNASDGYYNLTLFVSDGFQNGSNTSYFILDTTAPSFTDNETNATLMGVNGNATFQITVSDYLSGLSFYMFSWNGSGTWSNYTNGSIYGASARLVINKSTTLSMGNNVGYRWYANDSAGNWNESLLRTFVVANTPPEFFNPINGSPNFRKWENFTANITINDVDSDLSFYIFSTNASGSWLNNTLVSMSGGSYRANSSENISVVRGSNVCWRYYANDTENVRISYDYCFTVQNTAPSAPVVSYPSNGINYSDIPYINYSSIDIDGHSLTYAIYINGSLNATLVDINLTDWNATDGFYNITVTAHDGIESSPNSSVVEFRLDSAPPSWSLNQTNSSLMRADGNATFNITVTDQGTGLSYYIFSWNGTGKWSNYTNGSMSLASVKLVINASTNLSKGDTIGYRWYANDSAGNWNMSMLRTFVVANTPPTPPNVTYPISGKNYSSIAEINYSSSDIDGDSLTYNIYINNSLNVSGMAVNLTNWNGSHGFYNLTVTAYDGMESSANSSVIEFRIDISPPFIILLSPDNSTNVTTDTQTFICNMSDNGSVANLSIFIWDSNGTLNYTNTTNVSGSYAEVSWTYRLPDEGTYIWNCIGYDGLGNGAWGSLGNYSVTYTHNVTNCMTINSSGYYYMGRDITDSSISQCINIIVNDVELDCRGHEIDGNDIAMLGIHIYRPSNNDTNITLRNCTVSDWSNRGINIIHANNTVLDRVNVSSNPDIGLYLFDSSNHNITKSYFENNTRGIYIEMSSDSVIYDNYFNNTDNVFFGGLVYSNSWNVSKNQTTNIVNGSNIGGNFWATPIGTGWSENCTDLNGDDICDESYTLASGNIDYLPLIMPDLIGPNVTLLSPANNTNTTNVNQTFFCNLTDNRSLANVTLYIWNSSGALNYTNTTNLTGYVNSTNWTYTLPYDDTFFWNCLGYDAAGNYNWSYEGNYTLTLDRIAPVISQVRPANNTVVGSPAQIFLCNISDNYWIRNLTLFVWNSSGHNLYSHTVNLSGVEDENEFSYTLPYDGGFFWNCLGYDILGNFNWSRLGNFTINLTSSFISANFTPTTPINNTNTSNTSFTVNVSVWNATELDTFKWILEDVNYTIYNGSLVLMYNLDNESILGENYTSTEGYTIVDLSSYGNNGTAYANGSGVDGPSWTANGRYDGAFDFDGVDDYIDAGNDGSLNFSGSSFAVEAWVKSGKIGSGDVGPIVSRDVGSNEASWWLRVNDDYTVSFMVQSEGGPEVSVNSTSIVLDDWSHVAAVKDNDSSEIRIYFDGALQDSTTDASGSNDPTNNNPVLIGKSNSDAGTDYFNGSIDEVRIWNKSLSDGEVTQHYYSNLKKYDVDKWYFWINESVGEPDNNKTYNYSGYAEDNLGNENRTETRIINIEGSGPSFPDDDDPGNGSGGCSYSYSPAKNATFNESSITFGWTICDDDNLTCSLTLDGVVNKSGMFVEAGVPFSTSIDGIQSGRHLWSISCTDPSNNTGSSVNYPIFVDIEYPNVTFVDPTLGNYTVINRSWSHINVSASDVTSNITTFINFDDSLVSWWRFDEDNGSIDYMGRNEGVLRGDATQTRVGYLGQAITLDGSGDYINITGVTTGLNNTISMWVKFMNDGSNNYMFDSENGRIILGTHNGSTNLSYYDGISWKNNTFSVANNTWYHVAATTDNSSGNITLYMDGRSVLETPAKINSIGGIVLLGAGFSGNESFFDGKMDDVMIFNRTLSAAEIGGLYANQTTKYMEWNFTGLADGLHRFTAYAQDRGGNVNYTQRWVVFIDTISPGINFTDPTPYDHSNITNISAMINISMSEVNVNEFKWYWNDTNYTIYNDSLVLMYNFDNESALGESYTNSNGTSILDLSRYGNDGTLYVGDDGSGNYSAGRYGGAYTFDGADDYINITDDISLDLGVSDFTFASWIRLDSNTTGTMMSKNVAWNLNSEGYEFKVAGTALGTSVIFVINNGTGDSDSRRFVAIAVPSIDLWSHIVVVGDRDGNMTMYRDGEMVANALNPTDISNWSTNDISNTFDLVIGRRGQQNYLNGTIDEVRIWNRSMSASEVKQHYYSNFKKYDANSWYFIINETVSEPYINVSYNYSGYVKDVVGNENSTETRKITFIGVPPVMSIIDPVNDSRFNISSVVFNWTATDNISVNVTCNLTLDGVVNKSNLNVTRGSSYNLTLAINDGTHYWSITCWDSVGNVNSSALYNVLIDTSYPNISFVDPTLANASTTKFDWLFVNASAEDSSNMSSFIDFDNSLAGWWRFSEGSLENGSTLYDYSGYGNDGVVYANDSSGGSRDISTAAGYFGRGGEFDGNGDYVDVGNDSSLNVNHITVSAWVKTSVNNSGRIVSKHGGGSYGWMLARDTNPQGFQWDISINGADWNSGITSDDFILNKWYHIVATHNGSHMRVFLDGAEDTGGDYPLAVVGNINFAPASAQIGRDENSGDSKVFNGFIDDVMIFNRSLSEAEIEWLYANQTSRYMELNFTSLDDGWHTVKAYVQDLGGNVNYTERRRIIVDTTPPVIVLNAPVNNSRFNISSIMFNWTATDNISANVTCNLTIDGVVNQSNLNITRGRVYNITIGNLNDVNHYWNVTCWDFVNNTQNSDTYGLLVDTIYPGINYTNEISRNYTMQNYTHIFVNSSGTDANNISMVIDFDDSLISWWKFDELSSTGEAIDYMGRNEGSVLNASHTNAGYFGKGMVFGGDGDFINVSNNFNFERNKSFTVSAWVRELSNKTDQALVSKYNSSNRGLSIFLRDGQGNFSVILRNTAIANDIVVKSSSDDVPAVGSWSHVVVTYNGSSNASGIRYYLNGVEKNLYVVRDGLTATIQNEENLEIGRRNDGSGRYLNSTIDDLMIFNRSLTEDEIRALYANTSARHNYYNFTILPDGWHTFKTYVQDLGGNVNFTYARTVKVDTTAPNITSTSPSDIVYVSNVTISVTTDENATCKYISSTEGNMTTLYGNMTGNFSNYVTKHNVSLKLSNNYYEFYVRCKDVVGNIMNESTNISFTVDVYTEEVAEPSFGGGGGQSIPINVTKNVLLEVRGLFDKTLFSGDDIEFKIIIENKGELMVNEINLETETDAPEMQLTLSKDFLKGLDVGQQDELKLNINSLIDPRARIGKQRYAVVLNVDSDNPVYNTSKRFFIDLEEKGYQKRIESLQEIQFVEDLFKEHPECLELNEIIKQAKEMYENYEYQKAIDLIHKAIEACKALIALEEEEEKVEKPAPKKNVEMVIFLIEMVLLVILLIAMYLYYHKGKGGKESQGRIKSNLEVRFEDLFDETLQMIRSRDIGGARRNYMELHTIYNTVLSSSLPSTTKSDYHQKLIILHSRLS